jgi:hypothetical protein
MPRRLAICVFATRRRRISASESKVIDKNPILVSEFQNDSLPSKALDSKKVVCGPSPEWSCVFWADRTDAL